METSSSSSFPTAPRYPRICLLPYTRQPTRPVRAHAILVNRIQRRDLMPCHECEPVST